LPSPPSRQQNTITKPVSWQQAIPKKVEREPFPLEAGKAINATVNQQEA